MQRDLKPAFFIHPLSRAFSGSLVLAIGLAAAGCAEFSRSRPISYETDYHLGDRFKLLQPVFAVNMSDQYLILVPEHFIVNGEAPNTIADYDVQNHGNWPHLRRVLYPGTILQVKKIIIGGDPVTGFKVEPLFQVDSADEKNNGLLNGLFISNDETGKVSAFVNPTILESITPNSEGIKPGKWTGVGLPEE